jgi:hypothetical protein
MGILNIIQGIGLNPLALTVILWVSFSIMVFIFADGVLPGCGMSILAFIIAAIVVAAGLWLFNQDVLSWVTSLPFYLLTGILTWLVALCGIIIAIKMDNGFEFGEASGGCVGVGVTAIGFVASVLGIISFVNEYVIK